MSRLVTAVLPPHMAPGLLLWLTKLLVLLSCLSLPTSVLSSDYRFLDPEASQAGTYRFADPEGGRRFSELLVDEPRGQLVVGGRDAIFRLGLEGLTQLEKAVWEAKSNSIGLCTAKGQSEDDCRNFVKVLVSHGDQLFACGTNAFSPKCSWRSIEQISSVNRWIDGRAKCPYSPDANITAYLTSEGDYYVATPTDFSSNDYAIYRMSDSTFTNAIRTVQYNALWLAEANFVGVFETDDFMYFVFRETAVEAINCGKAIYSRIARVCKNDAGGRLDNWTTFLKARLNCSVPGDYPFYYNEIQSVSYLPDQRGSAGGVFYATFTTGLNSITGSAVCSFSLSSVDKAFAGPFKARKDLDSIWTAVNDDHDHFSCRSSSANPSKTSSRQFQMLDDSVMPVTKLPIIKEHLVRYTHVAAQSVATKAEPDSSIHVIFVATSEGVIKKLSFNTQTLTSCLIQVLRPFSSPTSILSMKLVASTASLYLGTELEVVQLPIQRCQRFQTQEECLGVRDPHCGWNEDKFACTPAPNGNPGTPHFRQDPMTCPTLSHAVDGAWGKWSDWSDCDLGPPDQSFTSSTPGTCQCRQRQCDNPAPANGGAACPGSSVEVTNCTQHGSWTQWSEWSACSKTCDIGMRKRTRVCGNPAPAFGGKPCIGPVVESQLCSDLPPCKGSSTLPEDEHFSPWSEWSKCSTNCGPGFKTRTRKCYSANCDDTCTMDYKKCEEKTCTELTKVTEWTPWVKANFSSNGSWHEKRFSFEYQSSSQQSKAGKIHEEERVCHSGGKCFMTSVLNPAPRVGSSAQKWTDWSKCTKECGGGYQIRIMESQYGCSGGVTVSERMCNTQPCGGEWGCWSEWSPCDSYGKRRRMRECESQMKGKSNVGVTCDQGSAYQEMSCDGWGPWGAWSPCDDESGHQVRHRSCVADECSGLDEQKRLCGQEAGIVVDPAAVDDAPGSGSIALGIICGFLVGSALGAFLVYYFCLFRRHGARGSAHYVSAKSQNLYVSLPMLDLKQRSFSSNQSDCDTLRSNATHGTLRSKASINSSIYTNGNPGAAARSSPSDYETATIKRSKSHRNSSLLNGSSGHMRADLDADQLFS